MKKLDLKGTLTGSILAFVIWFGSGKLALASLAVFFVLGTLASSWGKKKKYALKLAQENDGKRGIMNVLANGGAAGIISILAIAFPDHQHIFAIMAASSFSAACSDTLSSELGNVYGKKYFNIVTLKNTTRGLDGGVSIQGFLFGAVGSASIGALTILFSLAWSSFAIVAISGFIGNVIDSVLGATLQQKGKLSNHGVNFWATVSAATLSLIVLSIF
jgi:uncharacterized protein (TIGR00297 family)